jgi:hypothetical protein
MATPLTRQDLLAITDGAKNKILERLVTKYDITGATDNARDRILNTLNAFHVENQALLRQAQNHNGQMWQRVANLEAQIAATRQELRMLIQTVNSLYNLQSQQRGPQQKPAPLNDPYQGFSSSG